MHPIIRKRLERAARNAVTVKPPRTWNADAGLFYCAALPVEHLEPNCERISRVQGEKFEHLVESIKAHGLANPLITVGELPEQNLDDWREWRYRFLYTIAAPIKIVVGHNRYAAIQALGWPTVPVIHCGRIPELATLDTRAVWIELDGVAEAQTLCHDGELGVGPYSLVMEQFTPPLKAMPVGFEPQTDHEGRPMTYWGGLAKPKEAPTPIEQRPHRPEADAPLELVQELGADRQRQELAGAVPLAAGRDELARPRVQRKPRPRVVDKLKPAVDLKRGKAKKRRRKAATRTPARHR